MTAKDSSTVSAREIRFANLEPLMIPEDEPEMCDTMDIEPDPLAPHPGDRMVIDSDKPHWTPSISVVSPRNPRASISSGLCSSVAHSIADTISIAPSTSSRASTLVDDSSILSGKTTSTGYDMYGWEDGHDRKVSLESKIGRENCSGVHAIYPNSQSQLQKGLLYKVLNQPTNQPPMHH